MTIRTRFAIPLAALILAAALPGAPAPARAEGTTEEAGLALANYYVQKGDFRKAKGIMKKRLKADPDNENYWLVYETIVRQEMKGEGGPAPAGAGLSETYAGPPRGEPILNPLHPGTPALIAAAEAADSRGGRVPGAPTDPAGAATEGTGLPGAEATADGRPPAPLAPADAPEIRVDFREPDLTGGFSVAMGETLKRTPLEGVAFDAKGDGTLVLSFDLPRFPKKATLVLEHRIDGKGSLTRLVPLQVVVNDKPLFIRKIAVKAKTGDSEWNCTDLLKAGTNVIQISLPGFAGRYLLRAVRLRKEL